jgi:hypothetical protein
MSTSDGDTGGAGETAKQHAAELLGGDAREGYAEIGDQRLHYVEAGDGPLIVLLHGFPEFWYGWRLQIKPLAAAGFRVVLRSKSPEMVRQEIWGILLAHYAIRALMVEAAHDADLDPDRLSFMDSLRVIRREADGAADFPPSQQ